MATLRTEKCIVTGEKAVIHSGHVIIRGLYNLEYNDSHVDMSVLAGFKDEETCSQFKALGPDGYCGEWKPEFGVEVELNSFDKKRMGIDHG